MAVERFVKPTFFFAALLSMAPIPALAYVDPGSGSLFLQMLAAIGVGAMFYFSRAKEIIRDFFAKFKGDEAEDSNNKDA